jgi:Ser/Thr protein kinase RdoA (MazF antagonist)/ketosteroid isomerase-like protein
MDTLRTAVSGRHRVEIRTIEQLPGGYDEWADSWLAETDVGSLVVRVDRGASLQTSIWIHDVADRAAEAGVPCSPPLDDVNGHVAFELGDATVTVSRFVDGSTLDRDDAVQVRAAGSTLALLHAALSGSQPNRPERSRWDPGLWSAEHDPPALRDTELDAWNARLVAGGGRDFRRGVIHGDFWAGNLVWDAGRIASVLDWSEARVDVLARELAWSTFEFGHDGTNSRLDTERARTFLDGYRAESGPWEPGLAEVLVPLMRIEVRAHARYSIGDRGDIGYSTALQRAFAELRNETGAGLVDLRAPSRPGWQLQPRPGPQCENGGMAEDNVDLARRGYDAVMRGELDAVRDFLDPEVRWHGGDPSAPEACRNREQALEVIRQAHARGGIGELVDVVGVGEKVVVILQPPTEGDQHPAPVANLTTFRDGRAVEMVHYPDPQDAFFAAGVSGGGQMSRS